MKLCKKTIIFLMKKEGITQSALARNIGIRPGSLSNAMSERRKPGRKLLSGLLKVFPQESVASLTINDRK